MAGRRSEEFRTVKRKLDYAKRHGRAALELAQTVPFTDDDRELLSHTVGEVRAVLGRLRDEFEGGR